MKADWRILLIEDNPGDARLIREMLAGKTDGLFDLESAANLTDGLRLLGEGRFDLVLLDLGLPDSQGLDTFIRLHLEFPEMPTIVLSGNDDVELAVEAVKAGAQDYLIKAQVNAGSLARALRYAIERKRSFEALRASEVRYRKLFESAKDGILILEAATGVIVDVNPFLTVLFGYTCDELLGKKLWEIDPFRDTATSKLQFSELQREGYIRYDNLPLETKDGKAIAVEFVSTSCLVEGERVIQCNIRDITERVRAEEALRRSEERYRTMLEEMMGGYYEVDIKGNMTFCNDSLVEMLGYSREELIGLNNRAFMDEANEKRVYETFNRVYRTGESSKAFDWELSRKDGTRIVVETSVALLRDADGRTVGFRGMTRDVTERKWLEEQLRQSQKMEAVGNLAGGIAHDFNNLLQAMLIHAQVVRSHADDPERMLAVVRELERQVDHGASLTRQLLLFARRETVKLERLDLNDAVRDATKILQRLVRANIALAIELAPEALLVEGDRGQLKQVLMNLTLNASDAMPDGGKLQIRTGAADHEEVWLSVQDSGHGIPEPIRERIFEPFFTTKEASKGTGLGLSVVHGIVTNCGGRIEVESAIGTGATFKVILPRAVSGELPALQVARPALSERQIGRGERILIVEDEDATREALRDILSSFGFAVVAAGSGEEAGRLPADPPFDLLLTDLMLPGISGPDLIVGLRDRWPALKVILMSGYTDDEVVRRGVSLGQVAFLQKPFDMATLAREVRAALDEGKP